MAIATCEEFDCHYNNDGICNSERHCINKPITMTEYDFKVGDIIRYCSYKLTMVITKVGKNYIEAFDFTGEGYYFTGPTKLRQLEIVGHTNHMQTILEELQKGESEDKEEYERLMKEEDEV